MTDGETLRDMTRAVDLECVAAALELADAVVAERTAGVRREQAEKRVLLAHVRRVNAHELMPQFAEERPSR